jgi:uncharacterized PurR-regulated membrane protein YhhQ (DUF165 family)
VQAVPARHPACRQRLELGGHAGGRGERPRGAGREGRIPAGAADDARRRALLIWLCTFFVGFFVTAELLGAKLWTFSLFGLGPHELGLGEREVFVATAGILAFPLTFVLTDIINEYFGRRVVRLFTFAAIGVYVVLQGVVQAGGLPGRPAARRACLRAVAP